MIGILAPWRKGLPFGHEHSSRLSGCVLGDEGREKGTRGTVWHYGEVGSCGAEDVSSEANRLPGILYRIPARDLEYIS